MFTDVEGTFVRIVYTDDTDIHLEQGHTHRPAARFNRAGQDALYLSPDERSARVAISGYVRWEDPPRVLIQFEVSSCSLLDFRHPDATDIYELARQPWQPSFKRGEAPISWQAADIIRDMGHMGLIDPSRQCPGLWHIALLKWNVPGAPTVRRIGEPIPISINPKPENQ